MKKIKFEYRITLLYLILGGSWIVFSDNFLLTLTNDQQLLTKFQTYKGWFYVATTSILLFFLVKAHLKKLRKAEMEAKRSNELKTSFLQNISHEIRTPMNSIIGFSDILNSQKLKADEVKRFLAIIHNSSNQLLYTVNELLDISMLETGNVKLHNETFSLNNMIDEIDAAFSSMVNEATKFSVSKGLPNKDSYLFTDPGKLRQIIMNLLHNANKFTSSGSIKLSYIVEGEMIKFTVEDTGVGISEDKQAFIFERFQKAHDEQIQVYDGVGLGLAICKGNIELLNGDIGFSTTPGVGSVFYFRIPYKRAKS